MRTKLLIIFLFICSVAYAADRIVLQNGSGTEVGTLANPLYATVSGSVDLSAIDQSMYPLVDNLYDIGSTAKSWRNIYADGTLYVNTTVMTGTDERIYGTTTSIDLNDNGNYTALIQGYVGSAKVSGVAGLGVDGTIYSTGNVGVGTTTLTNARLDVGGFTATSLNAATTNSIGVKGSVEVDTNLYTDGSIYLTSTSGNVGLYLSQPDGGCSYCNVDAAGTTFTCINTTCPLGM